MVDRSKPVLFGVDRATAIRPDELPGLRDVLGPIDWMAVYIGGPRSAGSGWTEAAIAALHEAQPDLGFLPIYVGRNAPWDTWAAFTFQEGRDNAQQAIALLSGLGLFQVEGGSICLDVEAQTWDAQGADLGRVQEYIRGWCNTVAEAGYVPVVYGPARCGAWVQAALSFAQTWVAYWPATGRNWLTLQGADRPLLQLTIGGLGHTPDAWQFVGGVPIGGTEVDCSISSPTLALVELPNEESEESEVHPEDVDGVEVGPGDAADTAAAPDHVGRAEVDSLAGSASELYARVGRLEAIIGDWAGRLNLPLPIVEAPAEEPSE